MTDDVKTDALPATKDLPAVYTSGPVGVAAFLGGPISACWFMRKNFEVMGDAPKGRNFYVWGFRLTVLCGVAISLALQLLHIHTTDGNFIIPVAYTVMLSQICRNQQDAKLKELIASGAAKPGPVWKLLAYSLGWLAVTVACIVALGTLVLVILQMAHMVPPAAQP